MYVILFPDASLSLHLDAVMRLHEWQTKANRCNVKFNRHSPDKEKEDSRLEQRQRLKRKLNFPERKSLGKIRKHTAAALSASKYLLVFALNLNDEIFLSVENVASY